MLSRTDASGRPTMMVLGKLAAELSTSTSTGTASMPTRANVFSLARLGAPGPMGSKSTPGGLYRPAAPGRNHQGESWRPVLGREVKRALHRVGPTYELYLNSSSLILVSGGLLCVIRRLY